MTCPKCCGLMFEDVAPQYHARSENGFIDDTDQRACRGFYHCLLCGTYIDRVYLTNSVAAHQVGHAGLRLPSNARKGATSNHVGRRPRN